MEEQKQKPKKNKKNNKIRGKNETDNNKKCKN
jgi:hypothetical protein